MEINKKKEISQNPTFKSKRERRKKFIKIKDTLHSGLGKKIYSGIGEKKDLYCDICGKRVYNITILTVDNKLTKVCKHCKGKVI
jgi:NAD-dependent SIR2 family protein deacetylase